MFLLARLSPFSGVLGWWRAEGRGLRRGFPGERDTPGDLWVRHLSLRSGTISVSISALKVSADVPGSDRTASGLAGRVARLPPPLFTAPSFRKYQVLAPVSWPRRGSRLYPAFPPGGCRRMVSSLGAPTLLPHPPGRRRAGPGISALDGVAADPRRPTGPGGDRRHLVPAGRVRMPGRVVPRQFGEGRSATTGHRKPGPTVAAALRTSGMAHPARLCATALAGTNAPSDNDRDK